MSTLLRLKSLRKSFEVVYLHQHPYMLDRLVRPFLYERANDRVPLPARGDTSRATVPLRPAHIAPAAGTDIVEIPSAEITGVILAGGRGRRMGGRDKGLLQIDGRSLITHVLDSVRPQVGSLLINANRNLDSYRALGHPVVTDILGEYFGPLAGIASAMKVSDTPYLLSVPCDSPLVPDDLCARLYRDLKAADADISVAHDGNRIQPVFALLRQALLPDLLSYLKNGGRKIDTWYAEHRLVLSDFSDRPNGFLNINTSEELRTLAAIE